MRPVGDGSTRALIELRGLAIRFEGRTRDVQALNGVDLSVGRGEALGLVGESGSGKSITWLAALRLLGKRAQVRGRILLDGRDIADAGEREMEAIRGRRIAMIFQDATSSLNPLHRIGYQIGEGLRQHRGLRGAAARAEALRLLDRVQIPGAAQRIDEYPHELSGGMNQRVMIAVALAGQPELLVADEPTTALDATVQAQILALIAEIRRETGMALVLISHDLGVVAENCDRIAVMYAGRVVEEAAAADLFDRPSHPYTLGLLAAMPELAGARGRLATIPGSVPEPWNAPPGCSFEPRCPYALPPCRAGTPALLPVAPGHPAACLRGAAVHDGLRVGQPTVAA